MKSFIQLNLLLYYSDINEFFLDFYDFTLMRKESLENLIFTWHSDANRSKGDNKVTNLSLCEWIGRTRTKRDGKGLKITLSNKRQQIDEDHDFFKSFKKLALKKWLQFISMNSSRIFSITFQIRYKTHMSLTNSWILRLFSLTLYTWAFHIS